MPPGSHSQLDAFRSIRASAHRRATSKDMRECRERERGSPSPTSEGRGTRDHINVGQMPGASTITITALASCSDHLRRRLESSYGFRIFEIIPVLSSCAQFGSYATCIQSSGEYALYRILRNLSVHCDEFVQYVPKPSICFHDYIYVA